MKKADLEEPPLINIERNPIVLISSLILTLGLGYLTYKNLFAKDVMDINPLAFFLCVPTAILAFQTLWFLLNPFALIYEDRFEIKWSFFGSGVWYFIDFNKAGINAKKAIVLNYNDGETCKLKLFGIKTGHIPLLFQEITNGISASLTNRAQQ
ncbi:MAG: hypothetical protein IPM51_08710 [Sphingobacteriaceae bacterium]|nr:hypothetical protein [Sphingobacteriaceae bacterium]